MQKLFVRSIFHHNASFTRYLRAICAISSKPGYLLPVGIDHFFAGIRFTPVIFIIRRIINRSYQL